MKYEIRNGPIEQADFSFYGMARNFATYQGPEAIIHGPAETGKTISALMKLHICACKYPGASIVIARKTLASTYATVLQTFQHKVLDKTAPVQPYGGEKPEWFDYLNGSRIWMAGLDKSSKVLSSEHDIIYVNQVEELQLDDWETLITRTTGRAGNMPYSQTIGDANPSYPQHWMYHRPQIKIFYSVHRDNPALYNQQTGELTKQGHITIERLKSLTGMRRIRLYEGKPAQAEGVIYDDWNEAVHYIYADRLPKCDRFVAGQDWGFTHPGVLGIWAIDGDGRMYLVAQIYRTKKTINWWTKRAVELDNEFGLEAIACGPDQPAYIEQYQQAGLNAIPADNSVMPGINSIQQRLKLADDERPRIFIVRDSLRFPDQELIDNKQPYRVEDEFPSYVWANSREKEKPIKDKDDGMDMARYASLYIDEPVRELEIANLAEMMRNANQ